VDKDAISALSADVDDCVRKCLVRPYKANVSGSIPSARTT